MLLKRINDYSQLFDVMKNNNFFSNPNEQVETFLKDLHVGENWFSNLVVDIKIMRDEFGEDRLYNYRNIQHRVIDELFNAA